MEAKKPNKIPWDKKPKQLKRIFLTTAVNLIIAVSIYAQTPQVEVAPVNCRNPLSSQETYQCFIARQNQSLTKGQESQGQESKSQQEKEKRSETKIKSVEDEDKKQAEQLKQIAERSRKQNVSRKGQKYKVTYGRAIEPRK